MEVSTKITTKTRKFYSLQAKQKTLKCQEMHKIYTIIIVSGAFCPNLTEL